MRKGVVIVGGGLAGSEAAWQLARRGVRVELYEMRPVCPTAVHAVLVAPKDKAEAVRDVVRQLSEEGRVEAAEHLRVVRPWGAFEGLRREPGFQVKLLTVNPGAGISLQYHNRRAEHWVVVAGRARVTRDSETLELAANQSTYIAVGVHHRLENPGSEPLHVVEVQSGDYLGEDDIVRLEDRYGRS